MSLFRSLLIVLLNMILSSAPVSAQQSASAQSREQALYDRLPEQIKKKGQLDAVLYANPPHFIIQNASNAQLEGVSYELSQAIGKTLGIKVRYQVVNGLPSVLSGIQSGRYDIGLGPLWDSADRRKLNDFIDYIKESDAMIVPEGNPQNLRSLADLCGKRIGVLAAGGSKPIVDNYSKSCIKQNKTAITVLTYSDMPTGALAVLSGRADGVMNAIATCSYFSSNYQGKLNVARIGIESAKAYDEFYQGTIVSKGSPLTPVILAAYQKLFANGTYAAIMKKWHLDDNMIPAPGVNLAAKE